MIKSTNLENTWWSDSESSSDSSYVSYQSNNSLSPDWEDQVDSRGELFYVVKHPRVPVNKGDGSPEVKNAKKTAQAEKPASGILVRLIRRRSSRRSFRKGDTEDTASASSKKGEIYEVSVRILADWQNERSSRGEPQTLLETRLGLITQNHNSLIIIKQFTPALTEYYSSCINIGDYLIGINNHDVTSENINSYLSPLPSSTEITLKLRSTKHKRTFSSIVGKRNSPKIIKKQGGDSCGWLVYCRPGELREGSPPDDAISYSFPSSPSLSNPLVSAAGSFFTLLHLLPTFTEAVPISSTVIVAGQLLNVFYTCDGNDVMLLCLPQDRISLKEGLKVNQDLVRSLRFSYQSLIRCFTNEAHKSALDELMSSFFRRVSQRNLIDGANSYEFESVLSACSFLPLPKEIQVQLDDALNEIEANDIKEYDTQRLYTVIGCCYFHKGLVVRWHVPKEDLVDVSALLRWSGLQELIITGVQELVCWREVYPLSAARGLGQASNQPYSLPPNSRWFLLIVAQDHDMLVVLLESGGCTARIDGNPGPNSVYVEEAQATLDHIQSLGIPKFISKWLDYYLEPKTKDDSYTSENPSSPQTPDSNKASPSMGVKVIDPLPSAKRNSIDYTTVTSWEEGIRGRSLSLPNVSSSGPVLGRRAERERASETNSQSRISESDISESSDSRDVRSPDSSSLFDMSEFGKHLPSDLRTLPLFAEKCGGGGGLFHYVQLDSAEGVLIAPPFSPPTPTYSTVINSFRRLSYHIQTILNNTVSFKKLKSQDIHMLNINKSLIAVKEHGLLFECQVKDDVRKTTTTKLYWVVGRLFFTPQLKEVYVCYEDSCPQNMVEIAFRIALNSYI